MDNPEVFEAVAAALETGENVALVTVIATAGSTPGRPGYKMLVFPGTRETLGTVGGGLIEAKMIDQAKSMLTRPASRVSRFELGETPDDEEGICGGSVELLIETFDETALPLFRDLAAAAQNDDAGVLVSIISSDAVPRKILVQDARQIDATADVQLAPQMAAAIREAATTGHSGARLSVEELDVFVESVAKPPAVIVFGAGHVACSIVKYAKSVGFTVSVYDDRSEYANRERFPDADDVVVGDFGCLLDTIRIDAHSYVVIVTRGHKWDQIVLEQVLETNAKYIGMIGSRRKTLTIIDKLKARGFSEDRLGRVYSPIGISIGAVTPEEIALSVVCELVKLRRLGPESNIGHMTLSPSGGGP